MLILFFVGVLLSVGIDQITKHLVYNTLRLSDSVNLIDGVFRLTYCENRGAAFGVLQNQIWLFVIITVVVIGGFILYMIMKRPKNLLLCLSLTFICGGAVGNFIDRICRGFVVDFLDFCLINFPIFNIADCFVVVGAFMLAAYILFFSPEEDKKKDEQ